MIRLFAGEWIKMRHRWMPRILLIIQALIVGLVLLATGFSSGNGHENIFWPTGTLLGLLSAGFSSVLIMSVLAGAWSGNEYSWGTIRMVLTCRPNRPQQYLAGASIIVCFAALILVVAILEGLVAGLLAGSGSGGTNFVEILIKGFLAELLSMTFIALLAYTAGAVFRSPAAGIGVGIGLWIVEQILRGIFLNAGGAWQQIAQHFPYAYANALPVAVMQPGFAPGTNITGNDMPSVATSLVGLVVYVAILLAIGIFVVSRRDVTA